jgi:hypothetical protein
LLSMRDGVASCVPGGRSPRCAAIDAAHASQAHGR